MSTRSRILERLSGGITHPDELTEPTEPSFVGLLPVENCLEKEEKSKLTHSRHEANSLVTDPVTFHPDSCPDCAAQPNCGARRDCLELIKAEYRATSHDMMTCPCLRCTRERKRTDTDPVLLAERIGLKFGNETPEVLGSPLIVYQDFPLSWTNDPPHIPLYSWCMVHLHSGQALPLDEREAANDCALTVQEIRRGIARLIKDGDLVMEKIRWKETFRQVIQYPGGTA